MITLYGVTEDGTSVPVQVTDDGKLIVHKDESFEPGDDIEVGDIDCRNITASKKITAGGTAAKNVTAYPNGQLWLTSTSEEIGDTTSWIKADRDGTNVFRVNGKGSGIFKGDVAVGDSTTFLTIAAVIAALPEDVRTKFASALAAWEAAGTLDLEDPTTLPADDELREAIIFATTAGKINLNGDDGSITAAGNQCGFTSSGELFFTSRNERYKAVVQGGNMMAEQFPQPTTQDIVPED